MEDFSNLPWRISEPQILDIGTNFIKEKSIEKSYVYRKSFTPIDTTEDEKESEVKQLKQKDLIPGFAKVPNYPHSSRLNKKQHILCLKALELLQSGRNPISFNNAEKGCVLMYNNLKIQIHEENALFLKHVEKEWKKNLHKRHNSLLKRLKLFAQAKWQQKLDNVKNYEQFYKLHQMLPLSSDENPVEIVHEGCLLELGTVGRVALPTMVKKSVIGLNHIPSPKAFLPTEETFKFIKLPASQDIHAEKLAIRNNCDTVITSSGLKTIIDNYGPDFNGSWDIPVVVKEYDINGNKKKIIYIDKPFPQKNLTLVDLNIKSRKTLLKTNNCKSLAYSFDTPAEVTEYVNSHIKSQESKKRTYSAINSIENSNDSSNKFIKLDDNECLNIDPHMSENELCDGNSENNEILDEKMETSNVSEEVIQTIFKKWRSHEPKIQMFHNASYRKWKLKYVDSDVSTMLKGYGHNKEISLLVRCKIDGSDCTQMPLTLVPKLEYQWEHGGEIVTKSEILRQWTTLLFRPFSSLARVRMNGTNQEYIKIERCDITKVTNEGLQHYNFCPKTGLNVLYNVLASMNDLKLQPGQYLLHHTPKHGPFVALMKSVETSTTDSLNLHHVYNAQNLKIEENKDWCQIDTTLVLPNHSAHSLMPGMFPPHVSYPPVKGKRKKGNKGQGPKKGAKKAKE